MQLEARQWWCMPLIPVFRKKRLVDICEFEASLVYKSEFQDNQEYTEKLCLEKQNKQTTTTTKNKKNLPVTVQAHAAHGKSGKLSQPNLHFFQPLSYGFLRL